jgi:hypothetical protein
LSDWNPVNSPTIETTTGPDGNWAKLATSNATITSAAFTVDSAAQTLTFDLGYLSSSVSLSLYVATAPSYTMPGTATKNLICSPCTSHWEVGAFDLSPYRGQSIKIKFLRVNGTIGLDRIRPQVVLPGYDTTGLSERWSESGDTFAAFSGTDLISPAFTVDSSMQLLTIRLRGLSTLSDQAQLYVLSGPTFATSTALNPVFGDSWTTLTFDPNAWKGSQIKFKLHRITGTIGLDDLGVGRIEFPNWSTTGTPSRVTGTRAARSSACKAGRSRPTPSPCRRMPSNSRFATVLRLRAALSPSSSCTDRATAPSSP